MGENYGCVMNKILTLKTWLTIEDALSHLNQIFNEKLTKKDIYVFITENNLTLSLFCIDPIKAKPVLEHSEEVIGLLPNGLRYIKSTFIKEGFYITPDNSRPHLCTLIDGIIDIVPINSGLGALKDILVGNDDCILMDYTYVKTNDGKYYWLVDSYKINESIESPIKMKVKKNTYFPIGQLPDNVQLGVRSSELNLLVNRLLNSKDKNSLDENQALRERIAELEAQQPVEAELSSDSPYLLVAALVESINRYSSKKITQSRLTTDIASTYSHIRGLSASQTTKIIASAKTKIKSLQNKR